MKNILIINLRRLGDVYSTGHLISSMTQKDGANVSMLVYKESAKAAKSLKNISALYAIDRKEIITLKTNKLFSDGFVVEQFYKQLDAIKTQEWDEVINYSNDIVGAYLCSYLKNSSKKTIGVHFNSNRNVVTGSDWELLFNDVLPVIKYSPMHFIDCYHKMTGQKIYKGGEKIITNPEYNQIAFTNLNKMRNSNGHTNSAKLIGIQLKTADPSKDIAENTIVELIKMMKNNNALIPTMLIAPNTEERNLARDINSHFNDEIVVIETDLEAISSVLTNLDLLITPDTAIKHISDLCDTPVLEISLGHAPFLKQGTYSPGSLVLTDFIGDRNFSKTTAEAAATKINASDIMSSVVYFFTNTKNIRPKLSNNVSLYNCTADQFGVSYNIVAGAFDPEIEIYRMMARQLVNILFDESESKEIYTKISIYGSSTINAWATKEKSSITSAMKDLLGTLRSLLQSLESKKSSKEFISHLGKLLTHVETSNLVQIPVAIFKSKLESMETKSLEENAKDVEVLLYELKTDIQKILFSIKQLEDCVSSQKKDELTNKSIDVTGN